MVGLSFSRGLNWSVSITQKKNGDRGLKSRAQCLLNGKLQVWGPAGLQGTAED